MLFCVANNNYEISSTPQGDIKATEQMLPRLPSDYAEPVSSPEVDPLYEDNEVTGQKSENVTATDVKMEDNPAYA